MKKFILAAAVAGVLAGCNSDDVEKALLTSLDAGETDTAAAEVANATSVIVNDVLDQCGFLEANANFDDCDIAGQTYTPGVNAIDFSDDQTVEGEEIDNFSELELKVTYDQADQVITLNTKVSGAYWQFDNNLQTTYTNDGDSLKHELKIDVADFANTKEAKVTFDAQNIMDINDVETFRSSAENIVYSQAESGFKGGSLIVITDKNGDEDRFVQ
ncbi:hypothetical protein [Vibrio mytili]|uniref:Lipoprotein n=1 Tax=Vibrio mytili TaxID=50718 RepID=A0A0C3HUH1_9VIBR|nr:hypothetical protein [Vibrio mytili]KIN11881.1 hypothetical protein SU60_05065 [Vibrio mytili]